MRPIMLNHTTLARELGVTTARLRKHDVPNPTPVSSLVHLLCHQPDWLFDAWYRCVDRAEHSKNPKVLERLSTHPWYVVRHTVAKNEAAAPDTLTRLGADIALTVRRSLLGNLCVPEDVLRRLVAEDGLLQHYEHCLANNVGAPLDLREGISIQEYDKAPLASVVNSALEAPLFDERTGDPLPGVSGPGELLLARLIDEQGGRWHGAPVRELLRAAPHVAGFGEAAVEVFVGLTETLSCSLAGLVGAVEAVLGLPA